MQKEKEREREEREREKQSQSPYSSSRGIVPVSDQGDDDIGSRESLWLEKSKSGTSTPDALSREQSLVTPPAAQSTRLLYVICCVDISTDVIIASVIALLFNVPNSYSRLIPRFPVSFSYTYLLACCTLFAIMSSFAFTLSCVLGMCLFHPVCFVCFLCLPEESSSICFQFLHCLPQASSIHHNTMADLCCFPNSGRIVYVACWHLLTPPVSSFSLFSQAVMTPQTQGTNQGPHCSTLTACAEYPAYWQVTMHIYTHYATFYCQQKEGDARSAWTPSSLIHSPAHAYTLSPHCSPGVSASCSSLSEQDRVDLLSPPRQGTGHGARP